MIEAMVSIKDLSISGLGNAYISATRDVCREVRREGYADIRTWLRMASADVANARDELEAFCGTQICESYDARFVSRVSALNVALANLHAATAAVNKHAEAIAKAEAAAHAIEAEMIRRVLGVQDYDAPPLTDADFARLLPEGDA